MLLFSTGLFKGHYPLKSFINCFMFCRQKSIHIHFCSNSNTNKRPLCWGKSMDTAICQKALNMPNKSAAYVSSIRSDVHWLRFWRPTSTVFHVHPECINRGKPLKPKASPLLMVSFWAESLGGDDIISFFQGVAWLRPPASSSPLPQLSSFLLSAPCTSTLGSAADVRHHLWRCSSCGSFRVRKWARVPWTPSLWGCWSPGGRCSSSAPCASAASWFSEAPKCCCAPPNPNWSSGFEVAGSVSEGWRGGLLSSWAPVWLGSSGRVWCDCPPCQGWPRGALWRAVGGWSQGLHNIFYPHKGDCRGAPEPPQTDTTMTSSTVVVLNDGHKMNSCSHDKWFFFFFCFYLE